MDISKASAKCDDALEAVEQAVIADQAFLETVLLGVLARGHVIIEDVPGTGKTLIARKATDSGPSHDYRGKLPRDDYRHASEGRPCKQVCCSYHQLHAVLIYRGSGARVDLQVAQSVSILSP